MKPKKEAKKETIGSKHKPMNDLTAHYWNSINYFVGLIKSSELKAGLILSFYGIILNFMYQNTEESGKYFSDNLSLKILLGLWFVCCLISIYYSIRSFIPKIENKYPTNIFFFGDIISKYGNIEEFAQTFHKTSLNEEESYKQLGEQIFINAKIANMKFKYVSLSFRFMAIGLILLLMTISI